MSLNLLKIGDLEFWSEFGGKSAKIMPEENEENIKLLNRRVTRNCEQTGRGRIRINVSGLEFKTYASTLERFPGRISTSFYTFTFIYFYT